MDIFRFLVFAETLKRWMPDGTIRGPFGKLNFGNKLGFGPASFRQPRGSGPERKSRGRAGNPGELLSDLSSLLQTKTGPYSSRVNQVPLFIDTQDQRTESRQPFRR